MVASSHRLYPVLTRLPWFPSQFLKTVTAACKLLPFTTDLSGCGLCLSAVVFCCADLLLAHQTLAKLADEGMLCNHCYLLLANDSRCAGLLEKLWCSPLDAMRRQDSEANPYRSSLVCSSSSSRKISESMTPGLAGAESSHRTSSAGTISSESSTSSTGQSQGSSMGVVTPTASRGHA